MVALGNEKTTSSTLVTTQCLIRLANGRKKSPVLRQKLTRKSRMEKEMVLFGVIMISDLK